MDKKLKATWDIKGTDIIPPLEEEGMSDEEIVWHRLQHGPPTKTIEDFITRQLSESIRSEIDADILAALTKAIENEKHK